MLTSFPGFVDPVHHAQKTFRALLQSLARPGIWQTTAELTPPPELSASCAAACLTLCDLETTLWLQPELSEDIRSWLLFHTGCRFTTDPQAAEFALIGNVATAPKLHEFHQGSAEYPEASTSLLIQLPSFEGGMSVTLQGPGILGTMAVNLPLPHDFWQQWQAMTDSYPLGVDGWFFAADQVLGLPRTARLSDSVCEASSW